MVFVWRSKCAETDTPAQEEADHFETYFKFSVSTQNVRVPLLFDSQGYGICTRQLKLN